MGLSGETNIGSGDGYSMAETDVFSSPKRPRLTCATRTSSRSAKLHFQATTWG